MENLHQELKAFIIETMNLEDVAPADIDDDTLLFAEDGLGLDSIDALELILPRDVYPYPAYLELLFLLD